MTKSRKTISPEIRFAPRLVLGFMCFLTNSLIILAREKPSITPGDISGYVFCFGLILTSVGFYQEDKEAEPLVIKAIKKADEPPKKKKVEIASPPAKPVAVVQENKPEVIEPEVQERLNKIDSLLKEIESLKQQIDKILDGDQSSKTAEKFREITSKETTSKGKEKEFRESAYNRNQNAVNVLRAHEEFNTQKKQLTTLLKQINADREAKAEKAKKMAEKQALVAKPKKSPLVAYTAIKQVQVVPVTAQTPTHEFKKPSKAF